MDKEYIKKSTADRDMDKLNQHIDKLIGGHCKQVAEILQPLKNIMDKITYAELPSKDPLRIAIEETFYIAHKAGVK